MQTEIVKWGNSLGLRIPKKIAEKYGIREGAEIEFKLEDKGIFLKPVGKKPKLKYTLAELLKDVSADNRHEYISSGPEVGREIVEW